MTRTLSIIWTKPQARPIFLFGLLSLAHMQYYFLDALLQIESMPTVVLSVPKVPLRPLG
jgi:hypothetical protein